MATSLHRLAFLLILTACFIAAVPLHAQTLAFPTTINGVPSGEKVVEIAGDDVHMRATDLVQFGVGGPMWERLLTFGRLRTLAKPIEGAEAISLKSLAPYVTYVLDQENLTLSLDIKPDLLKPSVIESRPQRPADIVYSRDRTAFLNYAVSSPSLRGYSLFGEFGASVARGLLYTSFSRQPGGNLVRGLTNYTYDEVGKLRRWTAGDSFAVTENLGGTALITGLAVSRNFGLDPYFVRYPSLNLAGTALTPSQVDVYVNGVLVGRHEVAPGPFQLRDVPIAAGAGNAEIVIRDAFGREVSSSANYYFGTNLLTPGLSEFLYTAGVRRKDFGTSSFRTGDPAGVAYHRIGINGWLTAGARAEVSRQLYSGGPIVDLRTSVGEWRAGGAVSRDHDRGGNAGQLGYRYLTRHFGIGATWLHMSREYSTLSLPASADRPLTDVSLLASLSGRTGSLTAQWSKTDMRDADARSRLTFGAAFPIFTRVSALTSVSRVRENGASHNEYFAGASVSIGFITSASISAGTLGNGRSMTNVDVQRALPIGPGYGYRLQTQVDEHGNRTDVGSFQYQTNFGRYEILEDASAGHRPTLGASGALVFAGNAVHFTQPIQDSYALVEVPGVPNVRVFSSNQLVGRTDSRGNLVVPNLLAYYGNPLRIEDRDVPMTYEVGGTDKTIAPAYRGGAVVVFPVRPHRSITGTVTVIKDNVRLRPALGTLAIAANGKTWDSPVGRGGEFYFEDVPQGTYDATVEWKEGRCSFQLTIPGGSAESVKLGDVSCSRIQ